MNNTKSYKNKLTIVLVLLLFIFMLTFSQATFQGASSGLLLWFLNVLPTLLPFIIISNLMIKLNITKHISRFLYPFFGRIFGISPEGCYPVLIGFISGTPMGAKATADMVSKGKISREEGNFLFTLCNNYSPVFIISYIATNQLNLPQVKYPLFTIIFISSISGAIIYRNFQKKKNKKKDFKPKSNIHAQSIEPNTDKAVGFKFSILDNAIMNGFEVITKVGGYIILFSVLAMLIHEIVPASGILKSSIMGLLEITTGISQICKLSISNEIKIVLAAALTSFGGLSGMAQTKSVLGDTRLSMKSYVIVKLISAIISFILAFIYVLVFPIT